ncbi:MAG: MobC family plasmid mobilization relaxosome protein [Eggerthellaceae bacterium]|nr:MobC family plasmid mobilization relaxosome protein [Eggerthellaceae bacterium]
MSDKARRTVQFHFMASDDEAALIAERMEASSITNTSAFLRKMAIAGYIIHMDTKDIKEMVTLLRRCANNLNQYAKRANDTGSVYATDIEDIRVRLDGLWEMNASILSGFANMPR